jgi:hypothetical protein
LAQVEGLVVRSKPGTSTLHLLAPLAGDIHLAKTKDEIIEQILNAKLFSGVPNHCCIKDSDIKHLKKVISNHMIGKNSKNTYYIDVFVNTVYDIVCWTYHMK